ncbi:hypothetical protein YC2023_053197 [Brassica napus]
MKYKSIPYARRHLITHVDPPQQYIKKIRNSTERRRLGYFSCSTGNPIDDCWRCDKKWHRQRKRLASCAIGFGRNAVGGRDGRFYIVTDPSDHDPIKPKPGTLRYAVIQDRPLWIVFKRDMQMGCAKTGSTFLHLGPLAFSLDQYDVCKMQRTLEM